MSYLTHYAAYFVSMPYWILSEMRARKQSLWQQEQRKINRNNHIIRKIMFESCIFLLLTICISWYDTNINDVIMGAWYDMWLLLLNKLFREVCRNNCIIAHRWNPIYTNKDDRRFSTGSFGFISALVYWTTSEIRRVYNTYYYFVFCKFPTLETALVLPRPMPFRKTISMLKSTAFNSTDVEESNNTCYTRNVLIF